MKIRNVRKALLEAISSAVRSLCLRTVAAGMLAVFAMPSVAGAQSLASKVIARPTLNLSIPSNSSKSTPSTTGDNDVLAAVPPCSRKSAAVLNEEYNIKGWEVRAPSFADSLTGDTGCWRTNLAKHGFSFLAYNEFLFEDNLLNHYMPKNDQSVYLGQTRLWGQNLNAYLMFDLSRYGIPDGQISVGGVWDTGPTKQFLPNNLTFSQLAYYQTLFHRKLEVNIGYLGLSNQFIGTEIGGSLVNVLGPNESLFTEVGGTTGATPTPAVTLRWNITNKFYDKGAVSRSLPSSVPGGLSSLAVEHYSNPTGLVFLSSPKVNNVQYPTTRPLLTDEFGFKHDAGIGDGYKWIRIDAMYNTTRYEDREYPTRQVNNWAFFANADIQIWQADPDSPRHADKGVYVGGLYSYANSRANKIYQDYGLRAYTIGMFGRSHDLLAFNWEHQDVSPYVVNPVNDSATCSHGIECYHKSINSYEVYYSAAFIPGVHLLVGGVYINNPSPVYSPLALGYGNGISPIVPYLNVNHALVFLTGIVVNF